MPFNIRRVGNGEAEEAPLLQLTVSPGSLGLTVKMNNNINNPGAIVTNINPACTFKDKVGIDDLLISIDGRPITQLADLQLNKDKMRKIVIRKYDSSVEQARAAYITATTKAVAGRATATTVMTKKVAAPTAHVEITEEQKQFLKRKFDDRIDEYERNNKKRRVERFTEERYTDIFNVLNEWESEVNTERLQEHYSIKNEYEIINNILYRRSSSNNDEENDDGHSDEDKKGLKLAKMSQIFDIIYKHVEWGWTDVQIYKSIRKEYYGITENDVRLFLKLCLDNQKEDDAASPKKKKSPPPPAHPMVGMSRRENGNYNIVHSQETLRDVPKVQVLSRLQSFVDSLSKMNCYNKGATSCTCLHYLQNKPHVQLAVCHAILDYIHLTPLQRKHHIVERMRYANVISSKKEGDNERYQRRKHSVQKRNFALPLSYDYLENNEMDDRGEGEDDESSSQQNQKEEQQQLLAEAFSHRICDSAFFRLHNTGAQAKQTLQKYSCGEISVAVHQNTGRPGRKEPPEVLDDIRSTLQELHDEFVHSHECKRKGDEFWLPVSVSKRNSYEAWCRKRGWEPIKTDPSKGAYSSIKVFELLDGFYKTEEDASLAAEDGRYVCGIAKPIVSVGVFMGVWNDEFPAMKTIGRHGKGMFKGT